MNESTIYINFTTQFKVNVFNYNYIDNLSLWRNQGSSFVDISNLYYNTSNYIAYLNGYKINNGMETFNNEPSFLVYRPTNVTFLWNLSYKSNVFGLSYYNINVSYEQYKPLSNLYKNSSSSIGYGGKIFSIYNTTINLLSNIIYINNSTRYISNYNESIVSPSIFFNFTKQELKQIRFVSLNGSNINLDKIYLLVNGKEIVTNSSYIWLSNSSSVDILSAYGNDFKLINKPLALTYYSISQPIKTNLTNVRIYVSSYFGLAIPHALVSFQFGNVTLYNYTNVRGYVTFSNVPFNNYKIKVSAYGGTYIQNGLSGISQNIVISPVIYLVYLVVFLVIMVLFVFLLYEKFRKH